MPTHERAGLRVHPGIERATTGRGYGDVQDNDTFHMLAGLASRGAIKEWHAAPPCWSFGTLRRPRLRSKLCPAGFNPCDPRPRNRRCWPCVQPFFFFLRSPVVVTSRVSNQEGLSCLNWTSSSGCYMQVVRSHASVFAVLDRGFKRPVNGFTISPGTCSSKGSVAARSASGISQ